MTAPQSTFASRNFQRGVVLIYHGVVAAAVSGRDKFTISSARLDQHLRLIRRFAGGTSLLRDFWNGRLPKEGSSSSIVLTFDDGRKSDYEIALPALSSNALVADFFVNTANIGQQDYMCWSELRQMVSLGMGIHSHSHDHVPLSSLSRPQLEDQLRRSKELIEDRLGIAVGFIAVPYGFVNRQVVSSALALGYRAICHSFSWPAVPRVRVVHRTAVYAHTTVRELEPLLAMNPLAYIARASRSACLYIPKQLMLKLAPRRLGVNTIQSQA